MTQKTTDNRNCEFFEQVVMESADAIIAVDSRQNLIFFNPAAEQIFGYLREDVLGKSLEVLMPPRFRHGHAAKVNDFQKNRNEARYMGDRKSHIIGMRSDGTEVPLGASILKVMKDGQPCMVAIVRDISARVNLQQELTRMASIDPLTGALNRRAFLKDLERERIRAARYGSKLSLLLFDLDRFKSVNDTYGHDIGDLVICRFREQAEAQLRDIDLFGRWGGEEFVAALPHSGLRDARGVAERIRKTTESLRITGKGFEPFSVTVSIGVASTADGLVPHEQLVKWADNALYEAKSTGRNQVVVWNARGGMRALGDGTDG